MLLVVLVLGHTVAQAEARYASIVIDAETGEVLHADSADERKYPASLTKMMTLYLAFEAIKEGRLSLGQPLPVSKRAEGQPPSKLGLRAGSTIKAEDAILALVTKSANDVATVLAEALGGTEIQFARMMTDKARQLGMSRTTFRNASGLPNSEQMSSARDMAVLARALIYDHPRFYRYFNTPSFRYRGQVHRNHNKLLGRYSGADGVKTGYIRASGFNLAASAVRGGRRIIGVVFGGQSGAWRDKHMETLLDKGFATLERRGLLVAGGTFVPPLPIRKPGSAEPALSIAQAAAEAVLDSVTPATAIAAPLGLMEPATGEGSRGPDGWGVQVGAFTDPEAGQRAVDLAAAAVPSLLRNAEGQILAVATDGGTLFRARLVGLDEPSARAACAQLERVGQGCLTVPPQDGF